MRRGRAGVERAVLDGQPLPVPAERAAGAEAFDAREQGAVRKLVDARDEARVGLRVHPHGREEGRDEVEVRGDEVFIFVGVPAV